MQTRGITGEDKSEAERPLGNMANSRKYRTGWEQKKRGVSPGGKGCGQVTVYIEKDKRGVALDAAWGWSDGAKH